MQRTRLTPARDDQLPKPAVAEQKRSHAIRRAYAANVATARPPALSEHTIDIQKIMSARLVEPLMLGSARPAAALADAVARTDRMLEVAG